MDIEKFIQIRNPFVNSGAKRVEDENGNTNTIAITTLVSVMNDINDGKVIATHTSGDGTVTNIEETIEKDVRRT